MKLNLIESPVGERPFVLTAEVSQICEPYHRAALMCNWAGEQFGDQDLDQSSWAFKRHILDNDLPFFKENVVPTPYDVVLTRRVTYSWLFRNREDAMLFKLRWSHQNK